MPEFEYEGYHDIDVDEFLSACSRHDVDDLIDALIEDGYLKQSDRIVDTGNKVSVAEQMFEEYLQKLHGKWNQLSKSEEEILIAIAKRF